MQLQLWNESNPDYKKSISYRVVYIVCISLLFFLGYKWQSNLSSVMDILAADEAEYLRNGLALFDRLYKDWGPSYNIWYKILSLFTDSKIELYYLNYTITAVFSSILLFIVLERYNIHLIVAILISGMFFLSEINIETWPRVSHFVFICLLLGLYIATYLKHAAQKLFLFAAIAIIAAYARPEIRPFAFALFSLACIVWFKQKTSLKSVLFFAVTAIILFLFFQIVYGSPASFYRGNVDRMYIAFCQHLATNEFLHHDKTIDPLAGWRVYADKIFPECDTFTCILKTYPSAIFKNIWYNISNYFITIISTLGSFLFPILIIKKQKTFMAICLMLFLFLLFCFIYKPFRTQLFDSVKKYRWQFIAVFIIGLPSMMTSVLIFPRLHYLLCHLLLLVFVMAFFLSAILRKFNITNLSIVAVFVLFIVLSPTAKSYRFFRDNNDLGNMCGQKYIQHFNKDDKQPHVIFSDILNFSYMLPENYSDYSVEYDFKKGMQFDAVRQKENIDIVFVNENILKNPYLCKDSTWANFLNNYEAYGFEKKQVYNECNIYILQKKQ